MNKYFHSRVISGVTILLSAILLVACSSNNPSPNNSASDNGRSKSQAAKGVVPPSSTALAKIKLGMNDNDVRKILGSPADSNAYMSGKAWIPFYFGPDTSRTDWMYKGMGRVVFSRNHYSGALKVIRIDFNPDELK